MARDFPESDWKVLKQLHPIALDRYCTRVLREIEQVAADSTKTAHQRYLEIFALIGERNKTMSVAFDDIRRSTAFLRLANMNACGLLTDEEKMRFTAETRSALQLLSTEDF